MKNFKINFQINDYPFHIKLHLNMESSISMASKKRMPYRTICGFKLCFICFKSKEDNEQHPFLKNAMICKICLHNLKSTLFILDDMEKMVSFYLYFII